MARMLVKRGRKVFKTMRSKRRQKLGHLLENFALLCLVQLICLERQVKYFSFTIPVVVIVHHPYHPHPHQSINHLFAQPYDDFRVR